MTSRERILAFVLGALYLVPVWLYPFFPSQDGPSHLYNTLLFHDLVRDSRGFFSRVYEVNWTPFPNWTFTLLTSLLATWVPLELLEKFILTIYLVSFLAAGFYLARSFDTGKTMLGFAGFLFVYNWFVWMGFWNFCLSLPLALVTIGFAIRHRGVIHGQRLHLLMLLFLLLYFSHLVSFAITLGVLALLFGGFGQKRVRALLELLGTAAPALFLFVVYYVTRTPSASPVYWAPGGYLAATFFSFKIGPWFHAWETAWLVAFWIVLGTWLVLTWRRLREWSAEEQSWWLVVVMVAALCVALPNNLLGGTSLNERLAIFVGLFLMVTLSPKRWTLPKGWLVAAFGILVATQLVYVHLAIQHWNERIEPFRQLGRRIEPNSKVLPLLYMENVVGFLANPLLHADSYALAESRSVGPCNYEGFTGYFPIRYKTRSIIPIPADWNNPDAFLGADLAKHYDYVILWRADASRQSSPALSRFAKVWQDGDLILLKRR